MGSLLGDWDCFLGGGFKYLLFPTLFGEDSHFDYYFSNGLKPPPSFFGRCQCVDDNLQGTSPYPTKREKRTINDSKAPAGRGYISSPGGYCFENGFCVDTVLLFGFWLK